MKEAADSYISHTGENLWDFEVILDSDVKNINHIHPLKQRDVDRMAKAAQKDCHIRAVIVFGSAVRFDCHSGSDLDFLIVRDDDRIRIDSPLDEIESETDIIFSSQLGKRLREEIARTGVIVYSSED